jgi:hypothetical protein
VHLVPVYLLEAPHQAGMLRVAFIEPLGQTGVRRFGKALAGEACDHLGKRDSPHVIEKKLLQGLLLGLR